jgi:hypothetical protein
MSRRQGGVDGGVPRGTSEDHDDEGNEGRRKRQPDIGTVIGGRRTP